MISCTLQGFLYHCTTSFHATNRFYMVLVYQTVHCQWRCTHLLAGVGRPGRHGSCWLPVEVQVEVQWTHTNRVIGPSESLTRTQLPWSLFDLTCEASDCFREWDASCRSSSVSAMNLRYDCPQFETIHLHASAPGNVWAQLEDIKATRHSDAIAGNI